MLIVSATIIAALVAVTQGLPIGTNLALLHVLWALVSGQLLKSRGALFPALHAIGLSSKASINSNCASRSAVNPC